MTARYTYAEFQAAGLKPSTTCDGCLYTPDGSDIQYWYPCAYHEGYIEGYADALETGSTPTGREPAEETK